MKFSVCVPCFFPKLPACEALRAIAAAGFSAAEFWRAGDMDIPGARAAADDMGVEIVSVCLEDFRMNEPAHRGEWLKALERSARFALALGARKLITQAGQDTGDERGRQAEAILRALDEAKPILDECGVTLMLEPLNTKYDHKGYYLDTAEECARIVCAAKHERVRMVLDFYHQQASGGDLINTYRANKDLVAHVHIAGNPGRNEPWLGETNYTSVFRALIESGYAGAVGLEYIPKLEPVESLRAFAKAYAQEILRA